MVEPDPEEPVNDIGQSSRDALGTVLQFLPRLVLFLVVLAVGYFIAKALEKIIVRVLDRVGFERAVERGASSGCSRTRSTTPGRSWPASSSTP